MVLNAAFPVMTFTDGEEEEEEEEEKL